MQVKKFEAKTMKEALALVKAELGPDAIILSAKDMSSSHGLVGEKSVQVTAAVSEKMLHKKKLAENKLSENFLEQFKEAPASQQKQFIDQFFENMQQKKSKHTVNSPSVVAKASLSRSSERQSYNRSATKKIVNTRSAPAATRRPLTATQYIDISDSKQPTRARRQEPASSSRTHTSSNYQQRLSSDHQENNLPVRQPLAQNETTRRVAAPISKKENQEVLDLKKQIAQLKSLVENFQNVPQNFVSMHPGAKEGLPYELSGMFNKLRKFGFLEEHIVNILKQANERLSTAQVGNTALLDAWVAQNLMQTIQTVSSPLEKKYHVFVGGSGQGKTSILIKMAAYLTLEKKKKIAIVTADNEKVGAAEQLKIYSQILNIPFTIINSGQDWEGLSVELNDLDYVLVDTPSCNINDHDSIYSLKECLPQAQGDVNIHYVQSLLARVEDVFDRAQTYLGVGFDDVIFSHIDESSQYGLIYNFQKRFEVPVHSFSTGPKIPEDYEFASREKFVDLIFKLSSHKK